MNWEKVTTISELKKQKKVLFKKEAKQILLLETEQGEIYALDNRCPHEGYPLKEGTVDGNCVLTCNWHNWKFDLKTGTCTLGGDNVTTYPTKVEEEAVWVEIKEPTKEEILEKVMIGLRVAFQKRQYGRIGRELTRLHFQGIEPIEALKILLKECYEHLEFGMTHAYAATSDWVSFYEEEKGNAENQIICLTEALDHLSFDTLRYPKFPYASEKQSYVEEEFIKAIEEENEPLAVAMLRGALEKGLHFKDLEYAFTKAALLHYNDFGHSLIWVYKTGTLLKAFGDEIEEFLLLPLVRSLCFATKEDLIPEFKAYDEMLQKYPQQNASATAVLDLDTLFQKSVKDSLQWVLTQAKSYSPENIYETLLTANAKNLLFYNMDYQFSYERSVSNNIGWLDFTHALTFGNAIRIQCQKFPELWKYGLLQMACFNGRNHNYLDLNLKAEEWWVEDTNTFFEKSKELIFDHGLALPIYSAHILKTFYAIREELPNVSSLCQKFLLGSLNRFLHSPIKAKHVRRVIRQGIQLVSKDFATT